MAEMLSDISIVNILLNSALPYAKETSLLTNGNKHIHNIPFHYTICTSKELTKVDMHIFKY